jgi:hypothetical protein
MFLLNSGTAAQWKLLVGLKRPFFLAGTKPLVAS